MPRKYQQFPFEDIGLGLDTYSPKDKIPPGALSDALNIDAEANSTISLRKGYERYYGNFPFRPNLAVVEDDKLKLTFGDAATVDLSTQGVGPLYIEWKAYVTENGATSYKTVTYSRDKYAFNFIKTFTPDGEDFKFELNNSSIVYGYGTGDVIFLSYTKENSGLVSNYQISPELVEINTNTDVLTIKTSTNPAPAFVYAIPLDTINEGSKIKEDFPNVEAEEGGEFVTLTVNVSSLSFLPPLVYVYEKNGDILTEVKPYSVQLNIASAAVIIKIDTNGAAFTGRVLLISAGSDNIEPVANIQQQEIQTIEIKNVEDPFNFIQVWASGDDSLYLTEVSDVTYTQSEKSLKVGYYVPTALPESVQAVWYPATFAANTIEVDYPESDFVADVYAFPQISVWGFDHANSYRKEAAQAPYVRHVDNYRSSQDDERLIASLGGNLFAATSNEGKYTSTALESKSRVLTESKIDPLYITSARVSSIDKKGDYATVTVEGASPQRDIDIAAGYDYLVLTGCAYKANNGRYLITGVNNSASPSVFIIANPNAKDEGSAGKANSFSGAIDLAAGQKFALGDFVEATSLSLPLEVVSYNIDDGDVYVCGCTSPVQFAAGINLYLKRTSSILPLGSVEGIVRGDMLKLSSFDRSFRVKQVASFSDAAVDITTTDNIVQGEVVSYTASITVTNHNLNVGDKIFLYESNDAIIDGEHTISAVPDDDTIEFIVSSNSLDGETVKILGHCVEIDESITFSTGPTPVTVNVEGRWEIVESPINRQEGREESRAVHFDELNFYSQPSIQSSVVNNSMYLANGADETKKYDGASIYNAGLPPFQPWCFLSVDTEGSALAGGTTAEFAAIDVSFDDRYFVVDTNFAAVNDRIKVDTTGQLLTVSSVQPFGTGKYKIFVEEDIDSSLKTKVTIGTGEDAVEQLSGITINNYDEDLIYRLNTTDQQEESYTVTALPRADDYDVSLLSVKVDGRECLINQSTKQVTVYQPYNGATSGLVIEYEVPPGSTASWKGETVLSGVTEVEFDPTNTYRLTSSSSSIPTDYEVTVEVTDAESFNQINIKGINYSISSSNYTYDNPTYVLPDTIIKGKNVTDSVVISGTNLKASIYGSTDPFPLETKVIDLPDPPRNDVIEVTVRGNTSNDFKAAFTIRPSEYLSTSFIEPLTAFSDFYLNDIPLNIPEFIQPGSDFYRTPSNNPADASTIPTTEIKLPYNTDLSAIKVTYTIIGSKVQVYNVSTSTWIDITYDQELDLDPTGDYVDTTRSNLIMFRSCSLLDRFNNFYVHPIKLFISTATQDERYFVSTTPNQIRFTPISFTSERRIYTNNCSFKVNQDGKLTEYYDEYNYANTDNKLLFRVDNTVDRTKIISSFSRIGILTTVDDVPQISGTTINDFSDKVELLISNPDTVKTREYILTRTPAPANTTRELKSLSINGNIGNLDNVDNSNEFKVYVPKGTNLKSIFLDFEFEGSKVTKDQAGTNAIISGDFSADNKFDFTPAEGQTSKSLSIYVFSEDGQSTEYSVTVEEKDFKIGLSTDDGFIAGYYTTENTITVEVPFAQDVTSMVATFDAPGKDGQLIKANIYRYYMRYNAEDRNGNVIASAMLGSDDMYAEVFEASNVDIKALTLPAFNELDYSRIDFELYRTVANSVAPFYRVYTSALEYGVNTGYINIADNITDLSLTGDDQDTITVNLLGGELGTRLERPPVGKVVTSADNRLVVGNITSPHIADVVLRKNANVAELAVSDFDEMTIDISGETTLNLVIDKDVTFTSTISDVGAFTRTPTIAQGQWVYVFTATPGENKDLSVVGWYKTTAANTIPVEGDGGDANPTTYSFCYAQDKIPVYIGTDGNINQRNFYKLPLETQVSTKISLAINAVMAQANSADAWLLAQGGQSFPNGEFRLRQVANPDGQITITPTYTSNKFKVYVNNLLVNTTTNAFSSRKRFPSRLAVSYRNFSEIFDDCYRTDDLISSIIDVNPADGQEITAAVPFFGASAFGAAQLSQALVVFKTNSVYLVDIASNSVQKLQTQGQGCTAPKSVASTKNGIFFANESGVYRLGTDMKVTWMGKALDGIWRNELEKANINLLAGHNYAQERRYKLSYPIRGDVDNSRVAVYDSAREELGQVGSWTVYDNHPALGWCNQTADSFFASTLGRVYKVRNRGEASDYRDDDQGIPLSFTFGATNFGMPDERKITESVTVQFQNEYGTVSNVKVLTEQSLSDIFNDSGSVTIPAGDTDATIRFSLPQRKGTHVRTRITKDATVDEGFQISSLTYGVRTTGSDGVPQSRKFRS